MSNYPFYSGKQNPIRSYSDPSPQGRRDRIAHRRSGRLDVRFGKRQRPALSGGRRYQFVIIDLAFSGVIAVVSTVTVVGTSVAQSSRIDFAMSIASFAPVG